MASSEFLFLLAASGIKSNLTPVESHHSTGIVERAHHLLRITCLKIRKDHPSIEPEVALAFSRKAMNELSGPSGLPPTLLVFGELPRARPLLLTKELRPNDVRLAAAATARKEYKRLVNQMRIQRILKERVPPAAKRRYIVGDPVYIYREKEKRYLGPYTILEVDKDRLRVDLPERHQTRGKEPSGWFSGDQCRPVREVADTIMDSSFSEWNEFKTNHENAASRGAVRECLVTEIVSNDDPRAASEKFVAARKKELEGLINRGCFRVTLRSETRGSKILRGRFVLTIKSKNQEVIHKARFVIRGFNDPLKDSIVHTSPNVTQESCRLLLALASILGFRLWSVDVAQAYIQATANNMRSIFCEGPVELELSADEVLQIMRPLYGMTDSGDLWCDTMRHHHITDLNMTPLASDNAIYHLIGKTLKGLSATYVDDIEGAGTVSFRRSQRRRIGSSNANQLSLMILYLTDSILRRPEMA